MPELDEPICKQKLLIGINVTVSEQCLDKFLQSLSKSTTVNSLTVLGMSGNTFCVNVEFRN